MEEVGLLSTKLPYKGNYYTRNTDWVKFYKIVRLYRGLVSNRRNIANKFYLK